MIKILIVEDEKAVSYLIELSLKKAGYACECAFDGVEAIEMIDARPYDLIMLDVMLPGIDGFEVMDYIRPKEIPVIFITAKNETDDRVKGLRMGADDYIVKPFEISELLARVDAVLRRCRKLDRTIQAGGLTIDTRSRQVKRGDTPVELTPKEYELLLLFVRNPGIALYRETIYERIWGGEYDYTSKTVNLHVQRLRKKVGWEKELQTVSKIGYRFEADK